MKNSYYISLLLWGIFSLTACSNEENVPVVQPDASGEFTDERDGTVYKYVRYGDLEWMAENLRFYVNTTGCHEYLTNENFGGTTNTEIFEQFGYLYDYATAEIACPEGWRLPTDEEWQYLEREMGMSVREVEHWDWRGNYAGKLLQQGISGSGMELMTGGFRKENGTSVISYSFLGAFGFFWTSTVDESSVGDMVIYRKIAYNENGVYRQSTMKTNGLSVRCVRDVQQ